MTLKSFDLSGHVAIVTGSAGLLGAKHCEVLAEAGANIVCLDLDLDAALRQANDLSSRMRGHSIGIGCDITNPSQVVNACTTVMQEFGRIDVLINNARAGYSPGELVEFENFDLGVLRRDLTVQVEGAVICCQKFGAEMVNQRHGSIVNICSTYGLVAPDLRIYRDEQIKNATPVSYSVAKSALIGLTKYLASYWGRSGVRVNLLTPGGIRSESRQSETFLKAYTDRVPLGRMANPDEMQGAILFLSSDASSYMTGANLVVDGGWTAW